MFIRVLYCIFLGILIAMFVAWSMASIYPTPRWETEYPDFEQYMERPIPPSQQELEWLNPEMRADRMKDYETRMNAFEEWQSKHVELQKEFDRKMETQGRNVALTSILIAVVVTIIGLLSSGRLQVITEGLLLGGIFTLIYSIGWTIARAPKIAVLTVGIGLIVTIIVGYIKFVKPTQVK